MLRSLPFLLILAACLPSDGEETVAEDTCGAAAFEHLVGQPLDEAFFGAALNMRIIRPGDFVTMDVNPQRLNVQVDEGGVIERVYCG